MSASRPNTLNRQVNAFVDNVMDEIADSIDASYWCLSKPMKTPIGTYLYELTIIRSDPHQPTILIELSFSIEKRKVLGPSPNSVVTGILREVQWPLWRARFDFDCPN